MSSTIAAKPERSITLRGVRTHNLKNVDLQLPLDRLIVVTGVSGAGKSSLALDTLYAEGQRRYVETFSPYARQFLEKLDKPDADTVAGIPAAVAVGQSRGRHSSRSTVGTITEIHDALALLYAQSGQVFCRQCGLHLAPASPIVVSRAVDALPGGARYEITFPVDIQPATEGRALLESLRREGFTRARIAGEAMSLDDPSVSLSLPQEGSIDVIVDRLIRGRDAVARRADSIETAFQKGLNRCRIWTEDQTYTYVRGWRCSRCGTAHRQPEPNLFRYTSAIGACPDCEGSGRSIELDMSRIVPDPGRTIRDGAIAPWTTPAHCEALEALLRIAPSFGLPVDVPFARLTSAQVELIVEGAPGTAFSGLKGFFRSLERTILQGARPGVPQSLETLAELPGMPRRTTSARGPRRQGRGPGHRRGLRDAHPRRAHLDRRALGPSIGASRGCHSGAGREPAGISIRDRAGLSHARSAGQEPLGRRAPARRPHEGPVIRAG